MQAMITSIGFQHKKTVQVLIVLLIILNKLCWIRK